MATAVRQFVVLLVAMAQVFVGASASGGVACWGAGSRDREGGVHAHAEQGCSHASAPSPVRLPAPVPAHAPGDEPGDCPCIDVGAPVAHPHRNPDFALASAPAILTPLVLSTGHMVPGAWIHQSAAERPPALEPGLRVTRLLI